MAWCQSPGYDLLRRRRDLPDLARNVVYRGIIFHYLFASTICLDFLSWCIYDLTMITFDEAKEPLIYSHMAATAAWRDEMQGVARSQGSFSLTRDTTRQFARQAPPHAGCGQIGRSLPCAAWHRSPGYDLRRTRRDLPDLARNAAHRGINQRFLKHDGAI